MANLLANHSSLVYAVVLIVLSIIGGTETLETPREDHTSVRTQGDAPDFIGDFHIPTQPIPRLTLHDARTRQRLKDGLPVVLVDTGLFTTEEPWSLDNLHKGQNGSDLKWKVSHSNDRKFLYHNKELNYGNYTFTPPYNNTLMEFSDFVEQVRKIEKEGGVNKVYLKSTLYVEKGRELRFTFNRTVDEYIRKMRPHAREPANEPVVYIGMRDVLTPIHFDYNENMIVQVYGRKRCILVGPEHYGDLYPYPHTHPRDRQSMVDMELPDYDRFPRFRHVRGHVAILHPGDALVIPGFWWHLVESEHKSETVSLGFSDASWEKEFWAFAFRPTAAARQFQPDGAVIYQSREQYLQQYAEDLAVLDKEKSPSHFTRPDTLTRHIHMRWAIQQLIAESTGSYRQVGQVLRELYEGRFDDLEFSDD